LRIDNASGAFSHVTKTSVKIVSVPINDKYDPDRNGIDFNASASNAIYGSSSKVQMPAVVALVAIRY